MSRRIDSAPALLALLAAVLLAPACAATGTSAGRTAGPARLDLAAIRTEAEALVHVQMLLGWYSRTQGEVSIMSKTYSGHEALFSEETVKFVDGLAGAAEDPDEKRALQFLRDYLIWEYTSLRTAEFDDQIENAESSAKVKLEWLDEETAYRDLDGMLDNETDADRRQKLQAAQAQVWKDLLNPIHAKKEEETKRLIRDLGYSYVEISEQMRMIDLPDFIARSQEYIARSDTMYRQLLEEEVKTSLGIPMEEVTRAEIGQILGAKRLAKFFPPELMVPAFSHFLAGIGIDFGTAAGTEIVVDDAQHPKKNPRAACFPMEVPKDVRITVKPTGGLGDYDTMFHEGGHAIHFANAVTPTWEFQMLGNNTTTEGYAEFFAYCWGDPVWLKHYRKFVIDWNGGAGREDPVPVLTDADIAEVVKHQVLKNLYFVRRYSGAKLIYETILHDGPKEYYEKYYTGQTEDLQEVYRVVFGDMYGFELRPQDALRFRTDVDAFFYSADYSRAYIMAMQAHETMRQRYGVDWYTNEEVGTFLKETLFRDGSKLQGDEVAKLLGYEELDYGAYDQRIKRVLMEAAQLSAPKEPMIDSDGIDHSDHDHGEEDHEHE